MVVRLFQKEGLGNPTVLKLFDRRFASQLREEAEVEPWTMESEAQYHRFIQNGSAAEFITSFDEDYMSEDEEEDVAKKRHTYTMKCRDCTKQHGKCKAPSKTSKGNVFHIFYTPWPFPPFRHYMQHLNWSTSIRQFQRFFYSTLMVFHYRSCLCMPPRAIGNLSVTKPSEPSIKLLSWASWMRTWKQGTLSLARTSKAGSEFSWSILGHAIFVEDVEVTENGGHGKLGKTKKEPWDMLCRGC